MSTVSTDVALQHALTTTFVAQLQRMAMQGAALAATHLQGTEALLAAGDGLLGLALDADAAVLRAVRQHLDALLAALACRDQPSLRGVR